MTFPDPIACWIGPWPLRWYGLSYTVGIFLAWRLARWILSHHNMPNLSQNQLDGCINWGIAGIVIGGRLGHVFLFSPTYHWHHPLAILEVWKGGMSFHGGLLGVLMAFFLYCRARGVSFLALSDCWASVAPVGLCFGRLANFVNQELYGRVTDSPWGIVFPQVDGLPRHPSQLYEAALEGVVLEGFLLACLWGNSRTKTGHDESRVAPGCLSGLFLMGYGLARWICEYFREPTETIDVLDRYGLTLGQFYCIPLFIGGLLFFRAARKSQSSLAF
jgi:phosphatidylglycerol:prolipoprotein diacylglycerol transferase